MVGEPEAGTVSAEQAMLLLLLSKTELKGSVTLRAMLLAARGQLS